MPEVALARALSQGGQRKKISPPEGYPKAKHKIYYNYFPMCGKEGGLMVVNTKVSSFKRRFRVLRVAEDDTMNSHRYAHLAARGLQKECR